MEKVRPLLIVVCGPSGAGKSTLCSRLLRERRDVVYSVSCTTRAPRGSEKDGRAYHFLSEPEFEERRRQGMFLEHARVHGHSYGTLREPVARALRAGKSALMDIDVQGARQIRAALDSAPAGDPLKESYVDVFVAPPSLDVLRERLEGRREDAPETIAVRIRNAEKEMAAAGEFCYVLVNDSKEQAFQEMMALLDEEWSGRRGGKESKA